MKFPAAAAHDMIRRVMRMVRIVLLGSLLTLAGAAGCGDACEDLQLICDRCTDADYQQSCNATVTQGNQSLCDARKTPFNADCPFVLDASTSTTTAATTSGGGTVNGAGGASAGGASAGGASAGGASAGGSGGTGGN